MPFVNPIITAIRAAFRIKGSLEHTQHGPTRASEARAVLESLANVGPNFRPDLVKQVGVKTHTAISLQYGYMSMEELEPSLMCLGTRIYVDIPPQGESGEYVVVYDAAGPLQVHREASFNGTMISAKIIPAEELESATDSVRVFNPFDPDGFVGPDGNGENASLVRQADGGVTYFFTAVQSMQLADFPMGFPSPATDIEATYWRPAAPPTVAYQPVVSIDQRALRSCYQDESVPFGRTVRIFNRRDQNGFLPDVFAEFDENTSQFCEAARVAGQSGLFRYNIATDQTTAATGYTDGQAVAAVAASGQFVGSQDPRLVAVPVALRIQQDDTVTRYTNIGTAIAAMSMDGTDILVLSGYIAAVNFDRPGVYYCHNLTADYVGLGGYPNQDRAGLTCKIIGLTWRKRLCPLTQGLGASTYHVIDAQGGENAYIDIYDAFSDRYTPGTNTRDQFIFERVRVHYRGPYGPPDAVASLPFYYTSGMGSGCVRKNNSNDVRSAADHYFVDCQLRNDNGPVFSGVCQAENRFFLQGDTLTSFATSLAEFIDPATAAVMDPAVLDQVVQDQRPVSGGPGGGDVQTVNGQSGVVTLTTANIPPTAARGYVSDAERAAWNAPKLRLSFPDGLSGGVFTVATDEAGTYTAADLLGAGGFTLNGGGLPITLVANQQLTIALMNRVAGEAVLKLKP